MDSRKKYPRVLIINQQSMYKNNATGITMRSLWNEWPSECIYEICLEPQDGKGFTHNVSEVKSVQAEASGIRKLMSGRKAQKANVVMKNNFGDNKDTQGKKILLRQACVYIANTIPHFLNRIQMQELDAFQPQVIYTLGGSPAVMGLCLKLSRRYKTNIVLHFMDNWPEHLQWEMNSLTKPYGYILRKKMMKCLKKSNKSIAISPSMAECYEKKFDLPFEVLMNSVDIDGIRCNAKKREEKMHFVYAGGLHLERWKALQEIAQCLQEGSQNAVLDIYTNSVSREENAKYFVNLPVEFHDPVSHDQIKAILETADVLVHAETQNPLLLGFFKYSISTKIPEYLASGRPMLFYGPEELGLYQYLHENNAAFVASNKEILLQRIKEICEVRDFSDIICRAEQLAQRNHSDATAHRILKMCIEENIIE